MRKEEEMENENEKLSSALEEEKGMADSFCVGIKAEFLKMVKANKQLIAACDKSYEESSDGDDDL